MQFVDTNVLLYAISSRPADVLKRLRARALLARGDLVVSAQVLQEFYVQATRPSRPSPLSHAHAAGLVATFSRFPVQATTVELVHAALSTRARFGISYWDAAIIEAARAQQCVEVLSEDLSHGQRYNGVAVVNPFL